LPAGFPPINGQPPNPGVPAASTRADLKQVILAFHNYHDRHRSFPTAFNMDSNGQPLLSWRVHILPFIEQKALYDQFHLNEPWDSEHNRTLITQIPTIFAPNEQELSSQGRTRIVVPTGPGMAFEGTTPLSIRDFLDGTSGTLMAVEVASNASVIWTKPDDLVIDVNQPFRNLTEAQGGSFRAAFADGSVRGIGGTVAPATLKALFTRKGGETISNDSY
jgi:hypothetical protein